MNKRYRVVIEYDVEVRKLTPEGVRVDDVDDSGPLPRWHDHPPSRSPRDPLQWEAMQAFQEALLAAPEALDLFVRSELAAQMDAEGFAECEWPVGWREAVSAVIETLPARYRGRMREAHARGSFCETAVELLDSVCIEDRRVYIE
jgi:hypothetical protein